MGEGSDGVAEEVEGWEENVFAGGDELVWKIGSHGFWVA